MSFEIGEDVDTIKHMWAFNMPCALLINGGREYWQQTICQIYKLLYKEESLSVKTSLAAGLIEVANLIDLQDEEQPDS